MKKILFICSGGMSSTIVEKALKKEAEKADFSLETEAVGSGQAEDTIAAKDWSMILIAPQVKHRYDLFKKYAEKAEIPIELIKPTDYTPLGGKNLLAVIQDRAL